jgi:hypothetical protein
VAVQLADSQEGLRSVSKYVSMLHTHLSSGAGTIGQIVADAPSGFSLTRAPRIK